MSKAQYCRDILRILAELDVGECVLKGVISFELYKSMNKLNLNSTEEVNIHRPQKWIKNNIFFLICSNKMISINY